MVPVPPKWADFIFEYRIGYDAGTRFKKYFPCPGADTWSGKARDSFRAGWADGRKTVAASVAPPPQEDER
jgi:hypothetical protein